LAQGKKLGFNPPFGKKGRTRNCLSERSSMWGGRNTGEEEKGSRLESLAGKGA